MGLLGKCGLVLLWACSASAGPFTPEQQYQAQARAGIGHTLYFVSSVPMWGRARAHLVQEYGEPHRLLPEEGWTLYACGQSTVCVKIDVKAAPREHLRVTITVPLPESRSEEAHGAVEGLLSQLHALEEESKRELNRR